MRPPPRRQLRRRRPAAHISGKLHIAVLQLQPAEYSVDRILRRKPNKASNWRRSPTAPHVEKAGWAGKLDRARSRLYRGQFLQENMRWKALAEIYTIHSQEQQTAAESQLLCRLALSKK